MFLFSLDSVKELNSGSEENNRSDNFAVQESRRIQGS